MSYCRWSSDDYRCDLYVYDSVYDVTEVHVAGMRRMIPDDLLPPALDYDSSSWATEWIARQAKVHELLEEHPLEPIGGPFDGQSFTFATPHEAADWIEITLAPLGVYNYPDGLIAALRDEEEDAR